MLHAEEKYTAMQQLYRLKKSTQNKATTLQVEEKYTKQGNNSADFGFHIGK